MASIDTLKTLLSGKISDGRIKLSVYAQEKNVTDLNAIRLFWSGDSEWVSDQTRAPYYRNRIQVAVRHSEHDTARTMAYNALEYINAHRHDTAGVYFIPGSVPVYLGVDSLSGHVWAFDVDIKGAK